MLTVEEREVIHVLMDNRYGLVAAPALTLATGTAEREAAMARLDTLPPCRMTVGTDKYDDQREFVRFLRQRGAAPQVARKRLGSAIDGGTTRPATYAVSQRLRKLVEQIFGWIKTGVCCDKLDTGAGSGSTESGPFPWPPTTWCAGATC